MSYSFENITIVGGGSKLGKKVKNDLKKMLPRIPLVDTPRDFWKFSKAGHALAELHINYESVAPYEGVEVIGKDALNEMDAYDFYSVIKMRFPKKGQEETINYNARLEGFNPYRSKF